MSPEPEILECLPSELPSYPTTVCLDYETSGLYPDDGARVASAGVSWRGPAGQTVAVAWPFNQGLYGKPEYETAFYGWLEGKEQIGTYKNDSAKTGAKKGDPKYRKTRRQLRPEEVLEPNPNLDPDEFDALLDWLSERDIVAHNAYFETIMSDVGVDGVGLDLLPNMTWDTLLGQHILDPEHERGLKPTCDRLYGESPDTERALLEHLKARRVPSCRYDLADWSVIRPYLLDDVLKGLKLARHQWFRFRGHEARVQRLTDAIDEMDVLVKMERRGLPYNSAESLRWAEKIEAAAKELETKIPFRPTTPAATEFYFTKGRNDRGVACLGMKPLKTTKNGNPSLDAETLEQLAAQDAPHARTFYQLRQLNEAASRYYRGYAEGAGADGRIRTRFRQVGTKPGRLSCERINLTAIPHDHRLLASGAAVLAEAPSPRALIDLTGGGRFEGWHMDLAQAELRVASEYAGATSMLELVESGQDAHGVTAINLKLATGPDDPGWYKARSVIAKRSNFSLIFGVGHVTFRKDLRKISGVDLEAPDHVCVSGKRGCTRRNCKVKRLIEEWHDLYPEFRPAIDTHMRIGEHDKRVWIRDDIYRPFTKREIAYHDYHKSFNNRVQGNIGYFTKRWMVEAERYLSAFDLPPGCGLLLQIHDALLLMLPVGMRWLADQVAQIGRDLWAEWFTVSGGVDVEPWNKETA